MPLRKILRHASKTGSNARLIGKMRREQTEQASREIQRRRNEQIFYSAYGGGTFGED